MALKWTSSFSVEEGVPVWWTYYSLKTDLEVVRKANSVWRLRVQRRLRLFRWARQRLRQHRRVARHSFSSAPMYPATKAVSAPAALGGVA